MKIIPVYNPNEFVCGGVFLGDVEELFLFLKTYLTLAAFKRRKDKEEEKSF